jgi:O-antigen/teichoic acid export membrane protein
MTKTLKEQTLSALFWSFMDRGGQQGFQVLFAIALARLLSPDDGGLIAVLAIFTVIANILQESGFSSALVRKTDADDTDYSSVFYFNICISIGIYVLLFASAPLIEWFFDKPLLTNLSRFTFLAFVFNAFGIIQNVRLVKKMDFKTNAKASLLSTLVSGIVAVAMAYKGFGVWSLAFQQVAQAFLRSIFLWIAVKWRPKARFDKRRLREMYPYSIKLLINSLLNQISAAIYSLVFAKRFSFSDAGYYSYANKLGNIPQSVIASSLQGVAFPLLTRAGDDLKYKKRIFRKVVRVLCFIAFPIAFITITAAEPIVLLILREKWRGIIPILQILAASSAFVPLFYLLSSLLQSVGKSGLLLIIEMSRNIASLIAIAVSIRYGVHGVVAGAACVYIVSFAAGYHVAGKCIKYNLWEVLKDISPYLLISAISFFPAHLLAGHIADNRLLLLCQCVVGFGLYFTLLKLFGSKVMNDFIRIVLRRRFD